MSDIRHIYVLDVNGRIWFSDDGDNDPSITDSANPDRWMWENLTGNLLSLIGADTLQKVIVDTSSGTRVLWATGSGGVYRRVGNDLWTEYGAGLPNTLATDIEFKQGIKNAKTLFDDVLLAGTLGRGPARRGVIGCPGQIQRSLAF